MYRKFIKVLFDFFTALLAVIFLIPVFIIIAIAIKIDSKGPVLFVQERYGKNKKPFKCLKFRTMKVGTPLVATRNLDDTDQYITKVGRFLRKTSLDELPQLLNILCGQMSFIGPRPLILKETDVIEERDKYGANDIKPGMSGWAQINGRDELLPAEKARFDGEYVKKCNIAFDTKIFFLTILRVFKQTDVIEGHLEKMKAKESSKQEISVSIVEDDEETLQEVKH